MIKQLFSVLALASLLTLSSTAFGQEAEKASKYEEVKIKTSAVCEMCKNTIEKNLVFAKGVRLATLDLESNTLTVEYRPTKTTVADIRKAVTKLGYDADEMEATKESYDKLHSCCKKDMGKH